MPNEKEWIELLLAQDLTIWPNRSRYNIEKIAYERFAALIQIDYDSLVNDLLLEHPWLNEFTNYSHQFKETAKAFRRDTDATCWILRVYIKRLWGKLLSSKLGTTTEARFRLSDELNQALKETRSFAQFLQKIPKVDSPFSTFNLTELYHTVRLNCDLIEQEDQWRQLCLNVRIFGDVMGCSTVSLNPQESISKLHESFKKNDVAEELRDRVKEMELELGRQRRIITCLTCRHILERLPEHPKKRIEYANDWANFWSDAMRSAEKSDDDEHPLAALLNQFGTTAGSEAVEKVAQAMYGTLSTNIHHFKGEGIYEVREDQWDALPCAILRAIVPHSKKDGSVDWAEERKRFLQGLEDKEEGDEEEDSEDEDEKAIKKVNAGKNWSP
ncbi:hypothetical protein N431DRAFT_464373 [Stipitochalara longipes BDJ]|nr:hypothetical protein N431DRAFT_464373 [Stipitochalara longipes BDJ]